jgi:RNA polymerase sigma factor (sigma-70 family)
VDGNLPPVSDLVMSARKGEKQAWDALVERHDPLIWSVCHQHGLCRTDAEDVRQSVWLYLVGHLGSLRTPDALPGWLATATRRECLRVQRTVGRLHAAPEVDVEGLPDDQAGMAEAGLLEAERRAALRAAVQTLSAGGQQLVALLLEDPPLPYAEISVRLRVPVGSIGPYRRRYLDKMRRHPAIAALIGA